MSIPVGKLEKVPGPQHSSQELLHANNPSTQPKIHPHLQRRPPTQGELPHWLALRPPPQASSLQIWRPQPTINLLSFALREASLQELRCAAKCFHVSDALTGSERFRSPRPPKPHLHIFHKQWNIFAKHKEKKCTQGLSSPFQNESEPAGVCRVPGAHLADVWVRGREKGVAFPFQKELRIPLKLQVNKRSTHTLPQSGYIS